MRRLEVIQPPTCGPCTLCCKLLGVPELEKAPDVWCQHATKGKGCAIYRQRPGRCQEFECLWLAGLFGDGEVQFRPDQLHAVIRPTIDGKNLVIHEDPGWRGHARLKLRLLTKEFVKKGPEHYVIIVCGKERVFVGDPRKFRELKAAGDVA